VSIGLAGFPEHGITSEELLDAAGLALYHAKEQGADRVEIAET
jgi:GGDEF domain-containing protein